MARPDVIITLGAGGLGRIVATEDGTCGIIVSGVAVAGKFALDDVFFVQSLQQAIDLGITAAYDVENTCLAYRHIADFYDQAAVGTKLFVMVVAKTTTMANICLKTNAYAKKLLTEGNGEICFWGITRVPDDAYEPSYTDQLDDDITAAMTNAQALIVEEFAAPYHRPSRAIIEGMDWQGNAATTLDLRTNNQNGVALVIGQDTGDAEAHESAGNYAFVGYVMGRLSAISVQRNIGRVKDGNLTKTKIGFSNGGTLASIDELNQNTLNDLGFIFAWKHAGKAGYFFNDDHVATELTSDYSSLARGRTMDKAARIIRAVLVDELLDDLEVDAATGKLPVSVIKEIQGNMEDAINTNMTANGEISGAAIYLNPDQNYLGTDTIATELKITPKGTNRALTALLEYTNPLNS